MIVRLRTLARAVVRDAIDDVGAMTAFYAILAMFPMVCFVVTLAALVVPAHTIAEGAARALDVAPMAIRELFATEIDAVTSHARPGFAFGTVVFALWGASRGASALMLALNKLFGTVETRSWLRRQAIAIALTFGVAVLLLLALALLVLGPLLGRVLEDRFGLGNAFAIGWAVGRWMVAGLLVMVVWALAYRFLPDTGAPLRIFTPGGVISVGLWLAISRLFGLYFDHLGSFTPIYGALGSAILVLTWLWLSGMSFLFGAEINQVLAPGVRSLQVHVGMTPEPTQEDLAAERTEDLSRFESEGGSTEEGTESLGLQPRDSDHRGRILIVYASQEQPTYVIADALAVRLRRHGYTVEIGDAATGTMPPPEDYDVVILGLPMTYGHESDLIARYIEHNRRALCDVPSALFTVSKSGALRDHDPGGFLERFLWGIGWKPEIAAAFAGGEPFPREGMLLRLTTWMGYPGVPHDSAAYRTNWADVQQFADAIAIELADDAVTAERTEPRAVAPPP